MINCKVKTKVHDPPNLILGVDIRCLAEETCTFDQKKVVTQPYYFLDFLAYLANRSTVCLRGGGLRKLSFGENWLTGALIGVEFDRDQHTAHLDQVILTHL